MKRGDLVTVALQGGLGKPRPALIVQADTLAAHGSVIVLPLTTTLVDAPRLRPRIEPCVANGLQEVSQIMVDKVQSIARSKVRARIGVVELATMTQVDRALAMVLGLD